MNAYYSDAVGYNPSLGDNGRTYSDVWGIGSEAYSKEVMGSYMGRYATPQRLERQPTDEDIARIHNGGPNGYKRNSTLLYWDKVMTELGRQRSGREVRQSGRNVCSPACSTGQCCSSSIRNCNCLSSTFTMQPCMESSTGGVHLQDYTTNVFLIPFSAILYLMVWAE